MLGDDHPSPEKAGAPSQMAQRYHECGILARKKSVRGENSTHDIFLGSLPSLS